jgi:gas vesicle protein
MGDRMSRFDSFLFDRMDAPMIDGTGIQPDPELMQRNLDRAKEVIARMGSKWCCWQDRDTEAGRKFHKIKDELREKIDAYREAGEEELMQSCHSHTED